MVKFEKILNSIDLNKLETNYKNNSVLRTQSGIINDIIDIDLQLGSLSHLSSIASKNECKVLRQRRDELMKALDQRKRQT